MKRRSFIHTAGISIGILTLSQNKSLANFIGQAPFKMSLLRKDVGIFTEQGGTIAWMANDEGVVIVDTQFPNTATHLIDELKRKSQRPFRCLINTHHHGDHTSGNIAFEGTVDHVVGHANCLINQKANAVVQRSEDKQLFADTVFNDQWRTKVGSETVHAQYFGAGHTNGDTIIHFEDANIAHMGDLYSTKVFRSLTAKLVRISKAGSKFWIRRSAILIPTQFLYLVIH